LLTPTNVSIALSSRRGSSGDNYTNTVFDDEATTPISSGTAPFTGSYRPESPLSAADGIGAAGAWKLSVNDGASLDTGSINSWKLTLTYPLPCAPTAAPPPAPDGTFGSAMTALRSDASGSSIRVTWD